MQEKCFPLALTPSLEAKTAFAILLPVVIMDVPSVHYQL